MLVIGGAGYIGSHTAEALAERGLTPVVFDNLSSGHRSAVRWGPFCYGGGVARSVQDVIEAVERATSQPMPRVSGERRPGDPASLVASIKRIERLTGWRPKRCDLEVIVTDALRWRRSPGYALAAPLLAAA